MPHAERIAEFLLSIGAVRLQPSQPFTWTSGIKSPIYCDNRMIYSHPEARDVVVEALAARVRSLHVQPDVIAGTATAAIGWAALVADRLHLPFVYVRTKAKEHGAKKRIEGDLKPGKHVVVIEDLLSTGGSSISTVEALREEGKAVVTDVVSIFSYNFSTAAESAQSHSIGLHPLTSIATLLTVAVAQGRINQGEASLVSAFTENPDAWGKLLS
jgi:orotate phosphoribosyltransferase